MGQTYQQKADGIPRSIRDKLTKRNLEVMALIATGKKHREIAVLLKISRSAVSQHVARVCNVLGVDTGREAAVLLVAKKWL